MMKKVIAISTALALCLTMLSACGSDAEASAASVEASTKKSGIQLDNNQTAEDSTAEETNADNTNTENTNTQSGVALDDNRNTEEPVSYSEADIEVTGEYLIRDEEHGSSRYVLVLKNNAPVTLDITVNGTLTADDGSTAEDSISLEPIAPGEEYPGAFSVDSPNLKSVSYTLECKESTYYHSLTSEISVVSATQNDKNVIIGLKNDGSENAIVRLGAVFLDEDGNPVHYDYGSVGNKCSEMRPGDTLYCELSPSAYDTFTDARVFYTAYADEPKTVSSTKPEDFDVNCYREENSDICVFTVTNNSQQTVEVKGNVAGLDAAGNPITADNFYIDILGPGETAATNIGLFADDVADVIYTVMCDDYTLEDSVPIVGDLAGSVTDASEDGFTVSVTNNGQATAKYVRSYILLFDESGKYVGYDSGSIDAIEPNGTGTCEISNYRDYDHYELYFEAYGSVE